VTSSDRRKWTGKRGRYVWAGVAILALSTPVLAQDRTPQTETQSQEAQAGRTVAFDIPAQPLPQALTAFGRQSGLQVAFDPAAAAGKTSVALRGTLATEQALRTLLGGTGLSYQFTSAGAVTVSGTAGSSGAIQLDPVQVQANPVPQQAMIDNLPPPYAGGQVATGGQIGLLGNRDVMDTPFNQTSYTAKKVQDQQAKTIREALIDDPSVRITRPDYSPGADQVQIRGFLVDSSAYAYGGLFGILPTTSTMAEVAERVEVLKGPSTMLNGMPPGGYIGGTVNIVPKRAPDEPLTQATANYISAGQVGGHVDFARRFGPDKEVGIRLNGAFRAGQTDLQYNSDQRGLGTLGLDYRGERVRLSADLGYQSQYIGGLTPYLALANGVPLPWAPNARNNPTAQPWGNVERKDLFGVGRVEIDLEENVTLYGAVGAHDHRRLGLYSAVTTISNFNGTAAAQGPQTFSGYTTNFTVEGGLRAVFNTGAIGHQAAFTATTLSTWDGQRSVQSPGFATNIYNPTLVAQPAIPMPQVNLSSTQTLSSIGFADTLSAVDKRIQLTVGGRVQQVQAANYNPMSGVKTSTYDQSAFSPSVAVVVKPFWDNVSFYGNYIQGLQQGVIVQAPFTNAGEVFPPFMSTQYEAGVKVDWGKLTTTASLFQITQPSILTNVAANTQFLGGLQTNQGLEFNFFGEVSEGVRVLGGAMFLNAVLSQTQGGLTNGWIAPFSPGAQFNLGGEWDLPFARGLTLVSRAIYTGPQYIDTTFPRRNLPEWTRFDVGARYAFENPGAKDRLLVARFNVDNVLDSNFWQGGNGADRLLLGNPRTFRLSLTADF
jgi:iron complex outermembrane recepter protein